MCGGYTCPIMRTEVRGPPAGTLSSIWVIGIQLISLGGECLYVLSCLTSPSHQYFRDVEVGQPYSFFRSVETTNHIGRLKVLRVIKVKVLVPSQFCQSCAILDSSLYLAEYEFIP